MAAENPNYLFSKMSTVLSFPIDGISLSDLSRTPKELNLDQLDASSISSTKKTKTKIEEIDIAVRKKVKEIVQGLKASHAKFMDPDFGPSESDPLGAIALYGPDGSPAPAGTNKYPSPDSLRWDRPQYLDTSKLAEDDRENEDDYDEFADEFADSGAGGENEVWCMNGELFKGGSGSGDVVQGKLGDCWFLGALSVLGTKEALLKQCFWQEEAFKEFGLFVCCFHKDAALRFVIIDDRIPVFATSGKVVFGQCKDPDELWVPLIEKAYAKLHGCYKALIGGYVHLGLADLTGFVPRLIGLKPGYMGYSDDVQESNLWSLLKTYQKWGSLMGTSIQSKVGEGAKVEADARSGLKMGHAYSFLGCGELKSSSGQNIRLVRLRNPWGFGEWTGPWGDSSPEREANEAQIIEAFPVTNAEAEDIASTGNDGAFFMTFEDWLAHFTNLFVAIRFPDNYHGRIVKGDWTGDVGGPREMYTWITNPKLKLTFKSGDEKKKRNLFVGLYINDTRLTLGKEYYTDPLYKVGVGFDIVTEEIFNNRIGKDKKKSEDIPNATLYLDSQAPVKQPPYMFGATQVDFWLEGSIDTEYYIVPSVKNRKQAGTYFVHIYCDVEFEVQGGVSIGIERAPKECAVGNKQLHLTTSQFYEKTEEVRERILNEAKRLGIGLQDMNRMFRNDTSIPRTAFKRRLVEMGFSLADFPDDDFVVLDENNDGSISAEEFIQFFKEGVEMNDPTNEPPPPVPAPDDLVFQPIDLAGVLTVIVNGAKGLRRGAAWFAPASTAEGTEGETPLDSSKIGAVKGRPKFHYDAEAAVISHSEPVVVAQVNSSKRDLPPPLPPPSGMAPPQGLAIRPVTPYNEMPGGEFMSAPNTYAQTRGILSPRSQFDGEDGVEPVSQYAVEAGSKLHQDPILQSAEAKRSSSFLQMMRNKAKEAKDGEVGSKGENGLLISKHGLKPTRCEKHGDADMLRYLGMTDAKAVKHILEHEREHHHEKRDKTNSGSPLSEKPLVSEVKVRSRSNSPRISEDRVLGGRYGGFPEDIWDVFIDRVAVICSCRSQEAIMVSRRLNSRMLQSTFFDSIQPAPSPIPTPTPVGRSPAITGKTPRGASRTGNITGGTATARLTSKSSKLLSATALLDSLREDQSEISYVEIFRRIIPIPLCSFSKIDESLGAEAVGTSSFNFGSTVRSWFEFFDKNRDGDISLDEFTTAMKELNANLSPDDMKTLFLRFQTRDMDGLIDWVEFMDFWENNIHKRAVDEGGIGDGEQSLVDIISQVVSAHLDKKIKPFKITETPSMLNVSSAVEMEEQKERTTEQKTGSVGGVLGDLLTIDLSVVRLNAAIFAAYDIPISLMNMSRLSRVFNFDTLTLITFCNAMKSGTYENISHILAATTEGIMKSLAGRCQANKEFEFTSDEEIGKLWCAMAPDCDTPITYDEFSKHLQSVFCDYLESINWVENCEKGGTTEISIADSKIKKSTPNKPTEFMGVSISILCNLLSEGVFYSAWNRLYSSSKKALASHSLIPTVSYSAFKAFIKRSHVGAIEQKLQYLVHLQGCSDSGSVSYLCHIYVPTQDFLSKQLRNESKLDHLLLVAYDPLSSVTFKMKIHGDCSRLPTGDKLRDIIAAKYSSTNSAPHTPGSVTVHRHTHQSPNKKRLVAKSNSHFAEDSTVSKPDLLSRSLMHSVVANLDSSSRRRKDSGENLGYNPWETPVEDRAMMDLCSRLRLVNTGQKTICVVSEDPKFIEKLRDLIDKSSLPFFCIVNEIAILFEVGKEAAEKAGSVQKLVFGSIRKHPTLRNFLVNVISDMRVVISTYDSDVEESMEWQEMLAYLSDNRNPFVTVQLLPKYVHPERGMVAYIPDVMIQRYSDMHLKGTGVGKLELEPLDDEDVVEEDGVPHIQKGPPDIDGGSHPTWDNTFHIKFTPPKLTNCPVMFTDILLLSIDHCKKYVIVMVRVAEDKSLFMTAYDPRTATEYMLFGGPVSWCLPDIANESSDVFTVTYKDEFDDQKDSRLDFFQKQLELAIAQHDDPDSSPKDKFHLGFAITPRLLVCVYNQQGPNADELLGSCQVSISSVLSGTGNNTTVWTTLMHETQGASGSQSFDKAGALNLQLGYLKQKEIDVLLEKSKLKGKVVSDGKLSRSVSREPSVARALSRDKGEQEEGSLYPARMRVDLVKAEKLKLEREIEELEKKKKSLAADIENSKETLPSGDIFRHTNKTLPPANSSIVVRDSVVGASGVAALASAILEILLTRQKSLGQASSQLSPNVILRPFIRAVKALQYEGISSLTPQVVVELFGDLLITISENDAEALVSAAAPAGKSIGKVDGDDFINFFANASERMFPQSSAASVKVDEDASVKKSAEEAPVEVTNSASSSPSVVNVAIDWDTHPLPEHWSRKVDKKSNKIYYLNHQLKTTQWKHPLQTRRGPSRPRGASLGSVQLPARAESVGSDDQQSEMSN